jgi:hypothetical protein
VCWVHCPVPLRSPTQSDYAAVKARVGRVGVSTLLDMRPPPLQFGAYTYHPAEVAAKQREAAVHLQRVFRGWRQRTHEVVNALRCVLLSRVCAVRSCVCACWCSFGACVSVCASL